MKTLSFNQAELLDTYNPNFAMAYGSGVFEQEGYDKEEKPMVDFIFGTHSTQEWHKNNLQNNKNDYSLISKVFGSKFINYLQKTGAKIYYNPYVQFQGSTIKYWIMSMDDIVQDLQEWKTLYVAWRLQKPVKILSTTPEVKQAIEMNLEHALNTALLLLPENFTQEELYMTITGLSYTGDSRMKYWENPKKVENIVKKNQEGFIELYKNSIKDKGNIITSLNTGNYQQDKTQKTSELLYQKLPINLKNKIEFTSNQEQLSQRIKAAITSIVNAPSKEQTIKGFFTAWPIKSFKYSVEKIKKARKK